MLGRPALREARRVKWELIDAAPALMPVEEITRQLIRSFVEAGGDLREPTEIRFTTEMAGPEGAESEHLLVRLHGWGRNQSSSSATSACSGS